MNLQAGIFPRGAQLRSAHELLPRPREGFKIKYGFRVLGLGLWGLAFAANYPVNLNRRVCLRGSILRS